MSQHDPPPASFVDQSQQAGGVNLGAYNRFQEVKIGDVIAGDKVTIQTFQLIIYTDEAQPRSPAMRAALVRAYRSEIAARYAVWRRRYAPLPLVARPLVAARPGALGYEREDLTFLALRRAVAPEEDSPQAVPTEPHTFSDLREGLRRYDHMLLLGPPGGGKTTALWRLALDLAEDGLAGADDAPLPVFVRLGGLQPGQTLRDLLAANLATAVLDDGHGRQFPLSAHRALGGLLDGLLEEGRLVLLWDGLNETPRSLFATSARALAAFQRTYPGHLGGTRTTSVTTCRADDHALLLEACGDDPYPVQGVRLEGLDPATIHQVVVGRLGAAQGAALLEALRQPVHAGLAGLARTPLLLTMLCEVYAATDALPRNRGQLLQHFVQYRWEWERQRRPEGWVAVADQERAFARLAYAITESTGRGTSVAYRFAEATLRAAGVAAEPADLLRLGRAADLVEWIDAGGELRFTHQLVQEYFAAVALQTKLREARRWQALPLVGGKATQRQLGRYARPGARTGWEETLLLLAGFEGESGLARTLITSFVAEPLQAARLLKAEGSGTDPELREAVQTEAVRQIVSEPFDRRVRLDAGLALGLLGDPRFPLRDEEWRASLTSRSQELTQAGAHYWRYVPAGRYRIGGWKDGEEDEDGKPAAAHDLLAFWVARLPVTVVQFARFVEEGYRDDRHWTPNGLAWRRERTAPNLWGDARYSGANQSVVGVTWYEARAFCHWLEGCLGAALPVGYGLRLPTEAEWEVATAYAGPGPRREYPWGPEDEEPTPERAVYDAWQLDAPAPVGLCPAGAAACGALDMAGNVWEWCTSHADTYPETAATREKDFTAGDWVVPLRGGAYYTNSTDVRCGARFWDPPLNLRRVLGFRVVVSPSLDSR